LSPITPGVPPGQLPRRSVGQEVVIRQSCGWHCRSFVIVAIIAEVWNSAKHPPRHYTRNWTSMTGIFQTPPDLVVKFQPIDIVGFIL
jgi:hypothetical protein